MPDTPDPLSVLEQIETSPRPDEHAVACTSVVALLAMRERCVRSVELELGRINQIEATIRNHIAMRHPEAGQ